MRYPENNAAANACHLARCALIAQTSDWTNELEVLGISSFKRPEALYKALRGRDLLPAACVVDLESIPRNTVKAVDLRIPCPKVWIGRSAANPADIKNFGVYYSKSRPDELNAVITRLMETDRSMLMPMVIVDKQMFPFLVSDKTYLERLHHYTDQFASRNLITLHGNDRLELQLAAQYMAVEAQRARIWQVRSDASIPSILRKVAQARRPGTDVTIILSPDIGTESAREFHKSLPSEYAMIKLSARSENPVDALSFTLPRPADKPTDVQDWIVWFLCRASIELGIALSGFPGLVQSVVRALAEDPMIEDIRSLCERTVRQHATMMEDPGDFVSYDDLVHNFERSVLRKALSQHDWNLSATAKSLGLAESSLRYKLNKLGVDKDQPSLHNGSD